MTSSGPGGDARQTKTPEGAKRTALIIAGVVAALVIVALVVVNQQREKREQEQARDVDALVQALTPVKVVYEVEGDAEYAEVTMETPSGTSQQSPDLPMHLVSGGLMEFEFSRGKFLYLSAQNPEDFGDVTCRITVDGTVVSENTSSGAYAIATCKGTS